MSVLEGLKCLHFAQFWHRHAELYFICQMKFILVQIQSKSQAALLSLCNYSKITLHVGFDPEIAAGFPPRQAKPRSPQPVRPRSRVPTAARQLAGGEHGASPAQPATETDTAKRQQATTAQERGAGGGFCWLGFTVSYKRFSCFALMQAHNSHCPTRDVFTGIPGRKSPQEQSGYQTARVQQSCWSQSTSAPSPGARFDSGRQKQLNLM